MLYDVSHEIVTNYWVEVEKKYYAKCCHTISMSKIENGFQIKLLLGVVYVECLSTVKSVTNAKRLHLFPEINTIFIKYAT